MKAQFKYAFLSGLYFRGPVFAVVFVMNTVFITLGSLGLLPFAAHITAVSLGGVAIAVMMAANIIGDIAIARSMFSAPKAYLYALTPTPRWKNLLAGILAMAAMDFVTMVFAITTQVWLALNLAMVRNVVTNFIRNQMSVEYLMYITWGALMLVAGYFLIITLIMFCVTAKKSIFYKMPASGLMAFLMTCVCVYVINLLLLVLAPFGAVQRYGIFIIISIGRAALPVYAMLIFLISAGLFVLTSKLMEKRMNI